MDSVRIFSLRGCKIKVERVVIGVSKFPSFFTIKKLKLRVLFRIWGSGGITVFDMDVTRINFLIILIITSLLQNGRS